MDINGFGHSTAESIYRADGGWLEARRKNY
jgi:hypothetical protein